jgi:hypothetical protein
VATLRALPIRRPLFAELSAIVLGAQPLDQVLEPVAELSQQAIPPQQRPYR